MKEKEWWCTSEIFDEAVVVLAKWRDEAAEKAVEEWDLEDKCKLAEAGEVVTVYVSDQPTAPGIPYEVHCEVTTAYTSFAKADE